MSVVQGDVVRFDVAGEINNSDAIVQTYQARLTSGVTLTDLQAHNDWANIFVNLWTLIDVLHNLYVEFRQIRAANLSTGLLMGITHFTTPPVGTGGDDALPNQVTLPVSFYTTIPRVVLRKLWGPGSEVRNEATGLYSDPAVAAALAGAAFLLDPLVGTTGTWEYGFLSPKTSTFEIPVGAGATNVPGTNRRRRVGTGS